MSDDISAVVLVLRVVNHPFSVDRGHFGPILLKRNGETP
jgi:hypothetical protein